MAVPSAILPGVYRVPGAGCAGTARYTRESGKVRMRRTKEDKAELWMQQWRIVYPQIDPALSALTWIPEYEFAEQIGRLYRFDWALPAYKVAVEVDGGNHKAVIVQGKNGPRAIAVGRHTQDDDYWKRAAAASLCWTVFAFTPAMLIKDPWQAVSFVIDRLSKSR